MKNTIDKEEANMRVQSKLVFVMKKNGQLVMKIKTTSQRAE